MSFGMRSPAFDLFEQVNTKDADVDVVNLGIEYTSDDSMSQGAMTPIQRSRRQSPLDHNKDVVPSRLNTTKLREGNFDPEFQDPNNFRTPERHHSSDAVTVSVIKRAADLDCKSFLRIK